jgi:hypothetical protein
MINVGHSMVLAKSLMTSGPLKAKACSRIHNGALGLDGLGEVSSQLFRLEHIFP